MTLEKLVRKNIIDLDDVEFIKDTKTEQHAWLKKDFKKYLHKELVYIAPYEYYSICIGVK